MADGVGQVTIINFSYLIANNSHGMARVANTVLGPSIRRHPAARSHAVVVMTWFLLKYPRLPSGRLNAVVAFMGPHSLHRQRNSCRRHRHVSSRDIHPTTMPHLTKSNDRLNATSERYTINLCIPTAEDMEDVGGLLSVNSAKGDVILLDGDLGAGKTCFSRGFVRGRTGSENERVTSPTYLLSNTYPVDGGGARIYHMDLYRLSGSEGDLAPLDLDNAFADGICLVEWPSRLRRKPAERLDITLTIDSVTRSDDDEGVDDPGRLMQLVPHGARWLERLKFLESEGYFDDLLCSSVE